MRSIRRMKRQERLYAHLFFLPISPSFSDLSRCIGDKSLLLCRKMSSGEETELVCLFQNGFLSVRVSRSRTIRPWRNIILAKRIIFDELELCREKRFSFRYNRSYCWMVPTEQKYCTQDLLFLLAFSLSLNTNHN